MASYRNIGYAYYLNNFFLAMSINLVALSHWFWSYLNANIVGTCLNNRNGFLLFFPSLQITAIYFSSRPFSLIPPHAQERIRSTVSSGRRRRRGVLCVSGRGKAERVLIARSGHGQNQKQKHGGVNGLGWCSWLLGRLDRDGASRTGPQLAVGGCRQLVVSAESEPPASPGPGAWSSQWRPAALTASGRVREPSARCGLLAPLAGHGAR